MGWVEALRGTTVGVDTAPLIYFIEENRSYLPAMSRFFESVDGGELRVVTSVVTLAEVLVHPFRRGDAALADEYRQVLLYANHITTVPVTESIAENAAALGPRYGLRTPDAIQVATAMRTGASAFLTNDARLSRVASLKILVLDQLITAAP